MSWFMNDIVQCNGSARSYLGDLSFSLSIVIWNGFKLKQKYPAKRTDTLSFIHVLSEIERKWQSLPGTIQQVKLSCNRSRFNISLMNNARPASFSLQPGKVSSVYQDMTSQIESVKTMSIEKESILILGQIKHYLKRENKANKKVSFCEILRYMQFRMHKEN